MYIEPNSVVHLLSNVPLDNKYNHTLWFDSVEAQSSYFGNRLVKSFRKCTYQREDRGWLRVGEPTKPVTPENTYNCNYLMFKNTNFGDKWFYAFITRIEYLNNTVAQIYYQIDVMQTWFFNYELKECFIERQHTETDEPYEHTLEENIEIGDYHIGNIGVFDMNRMNVCIATSKTTDGQSPDGRIINGVFTPLAFSVNYNIADDTQAINDYLENIVGSGQEDIIVNMYQYPSWIYDNMETPSDVTGASTGSFTFRRNTESLIGYSPKNKRLFSYPFNFMRVSNNVGKTADYRYEDFDTDENGFSKFEIKGCIIPTPCVFMYPKNYKYTTNAYDYGLTISEFPTCPIVGDVYKAYMAQNGSRIATSNVASILGSTAMGTRLGGVGGAVVGLAAGTFTQVVSNLSRQQDLENTPPQVHGQTQCDGLNAGMKRVMFSFYNVCVKPEYAKIADDFFTMYGYAINRVGKPNIKARPEYTFIKTAGCKILGNLPNDDAEIIIKNYDNGITFWVNALNVGNYTETDNTPV